MFWFATKLTVIGENAFSLDSNTDNKVNEFEYASLGGGNIVVPHKTSSSDGVVDEDLPPVKDKKK